MDKAVFAMLKEAKRKMGAGKLIIFNPLHGFDGKRGQLGQEYLPVTDGAMVDDFDRARAPEQGIHGQHDQDDAVRRERRKGHYF